MVCSITRQPQARGVVCAMHTVYQSCFARARVAKRTRRFSLCGFRPKAATSWLSVTLLSKLTSAKGGLAIGVHQVGYVQPAAAEDEYPLCTELRRQLVVQQRWLDWMYLELMAALVARESAHVDRDHAFYRIRRMEDQMAVLWARGQSESPYLYGGLDLALAASSHRVLPTLPLYLTGRLLSTV